MLRTLPFLLLVSAVAAFAGCGPSGSGAPTQPYDPNIKVERKVEYPGGGARVGPVGGDYNHGAKQERYEGPVSKAPAWAK